MPKRKPAEMTAKLQSFQGFPKSTFRFLRSLDKNNNREWFQNNRAHYEADFLNPALELIQAMKPVLESSAPLLVADAKKSGGSLMRIYRDTRFSREKTPYKTNIGIQFRHELGRDVHAAGVYIHVDAKECFFGAGLWRPASDSLSLLRQHVDNYPDRWRKVVRHMGFRERFEVYDDRLKTSPRGYAKDHPMIDVLRLKSFIAMSSLSKARVQNADLVTTINLLVKKSRPWMEFLCEALGHPY